MKVLAVAFSARKVGNCSKLSQYCLDRLKEQGWQTELIKAYELRITPCGRCNYECFQKTECPIDDDVPMIYKKCKEADALIFAIPDYGGHLASLYCAFRERPPGSEFNDYASFNEDFLKKVNFIIVGNLSAGGDMALHEALHDFANLDFWPETLLFPAREYAQSSLKGDLIESEEVRKRLDRFVGMVIEKFERR